MIPPDYLPHACLVLLHITLQPVCFMLLQLLSLELLQQKHWWVLFISLFARACTVICVSTCTAWTCACRTLQL